MIFVDAREGISGDMLLAAMLGLLEDDSRDAAMTSLARAADAFNLKLQLVDIVEEKEHGLGISVSGAPDTEHGRSYDEAFSILDTMSEHMGASGEGSREMLRQIFSAEAVAHGKRAEDVHLHEIGRHSALLNIAGIGLLQETLTSTGCGEFVSSTITTGRGMTVIAHGAVRVPAPACRILLEGLKHSTGGSSGERATPTGIAAIRALVKSQSDDIPTSYSIKSIGFGTKRFAGRLGRAALFWVK